MAPLTILVGPNNSGKTALAQAIQLLAGGLAPPDVDAREPLPLESGGLRHGETFEDLVTGRPVHGRLQLSLTLGDESGESSLSATVTNVMATGRTPERQISDWRLQSGSREVFAERQGFDEAADYRVSVAGNPPDLRPLNWRGLLPERPHALAEWTGPQADALKAWAAGVRHLRCPRHLRASGLHASERAAGSIGPDGRNSPLALLTDETLRESVRDWYRKTFGVSFDFVPQASYFDLMTGAPFTNAYVRIEQAGRGLSHVLPVVVMALLARRAGAGIDVIEHPEAELHPAAHADIAELLLENLAGPARPLIVETHSEMILLRVRRWVAEERLPAGHVLVYWVHAEPGRGSVLEQIRIRESGEMETWPEGVFVENYEEVLAILHAARGKA